MHRVITVYSKSYRSGQMMSIDAYAAWCKHVELEELMTHVSEPVEHDNGIDNVIALGTMLCILGVKYG